MNKQQFARQMPIKRENKLRGKRWARSYGLLLAIHRDIDPDIRKRNDVLEKICPELAD
jgi:hypothetical protein